MKIVNEFKEFAARGNALDPAVGPAVDPAVDRAVDPAVDLAVDLDIGGSFDRDASALTTRNAPRGVTEGPVAATRCAHRTSEVATA